MVYQIINWESNFEGSKSKTYNNKTSCSMPCKHGLGYKRLIRSKGGPAMFGAWCALVQMISRHPKPRSGYLTDDGTKGGVPYTCEDLEFMTDISSKIFKELLDLCSSKSIAWVRFTEAKPTTVDPEGTMVPCEGTILPLNSDLDSDLDLDSDYTSYDGDEFISRFNEVTGKSHRKLVDKADRQLKARLKDGYSIDDIILATKNAASDDYHKDSGFKHLTPELITRGDKLDAWLNVKKVSDVDYTLDMYKGLR